jgi:glycosyltransferase involved in cell wall biosynthesis
MSDIQVKQLIANTGTLKILWASPNTLLDTSNGAAMMIRECLKQLAERGCQITILGGTTFVNPEGISLLKEQWPGISAQKGQFITVAHEGLEHRLLVTRRTERRMMHSFEEQRWFEEYCSALETERPDLVLFFDNSLITLLTASEARRLGIPVGVFLMHPNNRGDRWCRDVDLMLTDTRATATMYRKREGYDMVAVGTFIDPVPNRAEIRKPSHILFINPIPQKGVHFVIQLALEMEKRRPDIHFEIVDSRGTWNKVLLDFTTRLGSPRTSISNVRVTGNTSDMRPVYGRAKVLLAPSLWWDSGPRVVVEALLNGIPVVASQSGGIPEIVGDGGFILNLPNLYQHRDYDRLFHSRELTPVCELIDRLYDNADFYAACSEKALKAHRERHDIDKNADYLFSVLQQRVADSKSVEPAT